MQLLLFSVYSVVAQADNPSVYREQFFQVHKQTDIVYAQGVVCNPSAAGPSADMTPTASCPKPTVVDLKLDLYTPVDAEHLGPRPALVALHSGGYTGGDKDGYKQEMAKACQYFAARGYVAITVDYRLNNIVTGGGLAPTNWTGQSVLPSDWQGGFNPSLLSVYPAVRDSKAAIRWLRSKAADVNLDPEFVAAAGWSAGACTTAHLASGFDWDFTTEMTQADDPTFTTIHADSGFSSSIRAGAMWTGNSAVTDQKTALDGVPRYASWNKPLVLYRGTEDKIMTQWAQETLHSRLQTAGVHSDMFPVPGVDHAGLFPDGKVSGVPVLDHSYLWLADAMDLQLQHAPPSPPPAPTPAPTACKDIQGMWNTGAAHGLCKIVTNAGVGSGDGCTWSMVCGGSGFWQGGTIEGTKVTSTANDGPSVYHAEFQDDNTIAWTEFGGFLWTRAGDVDQFASNENLGTCTDIAGLWDTGAAHGQCQIITNAGVGSGDGCTWSMVCGGAGFWQGGNVDGTTVTSSANDGPSVYHAQFKDDNTISWTEFGGFLWTRSGPSPTPVPTPVPSPTPTPTPSPSACKDMGGMWNTGAAHGLCKIVTNSNVDSGDGCTWSMVCGGSGFWQGGTVVGTSVTSTANDGPSVYHAEFKDDNTLAWTEFGGFLWTRAGDIDEDDMEEVLATCSDIAGIWNTGTAHGQCQIITNAGVGSGDGCTWSMVCGGAGFWQGGNVEGTTVTSSANDGPTVYHAQFKDDNTISWTEFGGFLWTRSSPSPTPVPTPVPSPTPSPSPSPSGCPGGSFAGCIRGCPQTPDGAEFAACLDDCQRRCDDASLSV